MSAAFNAERAFVELEVYLELTCSYWQLCGIDPVLISKGSQAGQNNRRSKGATLKLLCWGFDYWCEKFIDAMLELEEAMDEFEDNHGTCTDEALDQDQNNEPDYVVSGVVLTKKDGSEVNIGTVNLSELLWLSNKYDDLKGSETGGITKDFLDKKDEIACAYQTS